MLSQVNGPIKFAATADSAQVKCTYGEDVHSGSTSLPQSSPATHPASTVFSPPCVWLCSVSRNAGQMRHSASWETPVTTALARPKLKRHRVTDLSSCSITTNRIRSWYLMRETR
jgi:hypothetical protein